MSNSEDPVIALRQETHRPGFSCDDILKSERLSAKICSSETNTDTVCAGKAAEKMKMSENLLIFMNKRSACLGNLFEKTGPPATQRVQRLSEPCPRMATPKNRQRGTKCPKAPYQQKKWRSITRRPVSNAFRLIRAGNANLLKIRKKKTKYRQRVHHNRRGLILTTNTAARNRQTLWVCADSSSSHIPRKH
jgi:hypothetical protein